MKAVYASSGADFQRIKLHYFDTVIGYFTFEDLDAIQAAGLKCILAGDTPVEHPAICGYMLYDEPDVNGIPVEGQISKIYFFRANTSLPLCVSCIEEVTQLCAPDYDIYFMDIYYDSRRSKLVNYLNAMGSPYLLRNLYPGKRFVPIMGLYDDKGPYLRTLETYPFARWFRASFKTSDHAMFFWKGAPPESFGIVDRECYQGMALILNQTSDSRNAVVDALLSQLARLVLWVNRHTGWIKIRN